MKELSDCTVLVVDDTEANVDILVDALGEIYDVSVAMDGQAALETVDLLFKSAPLHDIGKVGVPDAILLNRANSPMRSSPS